MDLARFKQPVAVVLALVSVVLLVWGFGGRGPVLTGATPSFLRWPYGLGLLAALVAYCFFFDARAGLYWLAGSAPAGAILAAVRPRLWGGELTADRLVTGTVLVMAIVLGAAVYYRRA